jgi:hypothetical protein
MGGHMQLSELFAFLSVVMLCVFSFVSIAVWVDGRRKEREAYYKAESLRRIAEMPTESAAQMIAMMREEELYRRQQEQMREGKNLEGMKLGGLVNIAVGISLGVMIYFTSHKPAAALVGLIPGLIGVALLVHAYLFAAAPRQKSPYRREGHGMGIRLLLPFGCTTPV